MNGLIEWFARNRVAANLLMVFIILMGVNGIVTICHGSASARAIRNAVQHSVEALDHHINEHIIDAVTRANAKLAEARPEPAVAQA